MTFGKVAGFPRGSNSMGDGFRGLGGNGSSGGVGDSFSVFIISLGIQFLAGRKLVIVHPMVTMRRTRTPTPRGWRDE